MSEYQVNRIRDLERKVNELRAAYEGERDAALLYAAVGVVGWAAFVVALLVS